MRITTSRLIFPLAVVFTTALAVPAGADPITPTPEGLAIEVPPPAAPERCDACESDVRNPTFLWQWHETPLAGGGGSRVSSSLVSIDQVPEPSLLLLMAFAGGLAVRRRVQA